MDVDVAKYLSELNLKIRRGCTAHITRTGRLYYMNHETKTSSWLPPVESWDSGGLGLPYGWEAAFDREGKTYFINHVNKTTTNEDPRKDLDEDPPQPRDVELFRDPQKGFGFVAGSERPVIVRFITEGGPSEGQLVPGDQILQINGEDVIKSPRDRVIELVRSCKHSVKLQVCQPITNNTTRKSALLTAAKKAKLKSNPSRVRFAEGVVINGSPLYSPSPFDSHVPFMPNVLKVFLENGQTKSFKYDGTTTVQDVLDVLQEKLSVRSPEHFSLVVEHIRSARRNRLSILNPKDTLARIAARPGSHHLRCLFRLTFVPKDIYELMQKDPVAFDYLFVQCSNDVVKERFSPELKYDIALRLAALHLHQHAVASGMQGKMLVKSIEREYGLEKFVPASLLETMKRKELLKLLNQLMKQNQALAGPGQKQLTAAQAKFHYLKIVSDLATYGARTFATCSKNSAMEIAILVGPRIGLSQISTIRNIAPINLCQFSELESVEVTREDDFSYKIRIKLRHHEKEFLNILMEERETEEFVLVLERYYSQLIGNELPVEWEGRDPEPVERVPSYHSRHIVQDSPWSYCPASSPQQQQQESLGVSPAVKTIDFSIPPPPYIPCEERRLSRSNSRDQFSLATSPSSVDHNMNEMQALVASIASLPLALAKAAKLSSCREDSAKETAKDFADDDPSSVTTEDEEEETLSTKSADSDRTLTDKTDAAAAQLQRRRMHDGVGVDMHSVMSMELLEEEEERRTDSPGRDAVHRVAEMSKIVSDAQMYLRSDRPPRQFDCSDDDVLGLKSADSLLFGQRPEDFDGLLTPSSDMMPSESEAESTPTNSPTRQQTNTDQEGSKKMGSSFGLHSPHLLASLDQESEDIEELLRQLQASTSLPFEGNSLCLDPDIIDLTIVPPPEPDDVDFGCVTPDGMDDRSKSFLDQETGQRRDFYAHDGCPNAPDSFESGSSENSHPGSLNIIKPPSSLTYAGCNDSVSNSSEPAEPLSAGEDDLSAYIIPPPPPSSTLFVEEQNRVLARFKQAADEIRQMMDHGNENLSGSKYSASMNSVSKFCTIPRRHEEVHRPPLSSLSSLATPVREKIASSNVFSLPPSQMPEQAPSGGRSVNHSADRAQRHSNMNGSAIEEDDGSWRPQPPPRVKRINSSSEIVPDCTGRRTKDGAGVEPNSGNQNGHFSRTLSLDSFKGVPNRTEQTSQNGSSSHSRPTGKRHEPDHQLPNGHHPHAGCQDDDSRLLPRLPNGHSNGGLNGECNGYSPSDYDLREEEPSTEEPCEVCVRGKNGLVNGCVCKKLSRFLSYHQSLPRKAINSRYLQPVNGGLTSTGAFNTAQQEIADMIENLDSVCRTRIQECEDPGQSLSDDFSKLTKVRDTLICESRQFVTASKLFVKSITESSDRMEENLTTCLALLDRIFAVSELVVTEMTVPSQIHCLAEKLKEMAVAYSRTVQAARSAAAGEIPNSNMAGLMHQATSLATSLTTLMRTLRTFNYP